MPITNHDKLQLLKDLLENQAAEHYMSTDEAAQIERLVSSLSDDASLQPTVLETLGHIQQKHQLNHEPFEQNDVEQWLNVLSIE
ncbi:YtzH-like family protein [Alkalihalobacillus sp. MEB130]|uniref:YtzH-like family protein n=1 Tax=Alkalihalobacillus sp. MEB130 TaxID=2976704 RepID=UPI0028DDDCE3|nr:YtzH-like family protein [Alkalihalobacillus sp. MEB130]MDT8859346.1 YtzH-like family protein [Alkalihalobacillus sp. MEB130]